MNPLYKGSELKSCLLKADVKALIMNEKLDDHDFYEILREAIPEVDDYGYRKLIQSKEIPLLHLVVIISSHDYR